MTALDLFSELGHEEVVLAHDAASGLHAVIAIHDTTFGPAVGGTRMQPYPTFDDAVEDALRLSHAMTYKAVMAEMPRGGGKAVILGDPARQKSEALLTAYADLLNRLNGRFHTGCDMGIDLTDVAELARWTRHTSHTPTGSRWDTADLAALGVQEAIRAAAGFLGHGLQGLHVAVQGLGQVGLRLARMLRAEGARLTVTDVDAQRMEACARELGAAAIDAERIYEVDADVFSPNARGGILNDLTIPRLRCRAIVGAANAQLAEPRHGDALHDRGILYAPDYVVNAGGLLSLLLELGETDEDGVVARVKGIGPRLLSLLERARADSLPPHRAADRAVEERLAAARAARGRGRST